MDEPPVVHIYRASDRPELFNFLREVYPPDDSGLFIAQWVWRYEQSPFTLPDDLDIMILRIGNRMVGLSAAFRVRMWMGGIECAGEGRGAFIVHPDYRGRNLWLNVKVPHAFAPVQFGWSRLPSRVTARLKRPSDPLRPLVRVLDPGPLCEHFSHSPLVGSIGRAVGTAFRVASSQLRRARGNVVRLNAFDFRVDRLWERARRPDRAMIIRNHQYLNWRYCQRPDATYSLYGVERDSELAGFLVARTTTYRGMRWGYLIDFLTPENERGVLSSLIDAALDEFRRSGVAAVACYATDPTARAALFRAGFFPAPQREPVRFVRRMQGTRKDLAKFAALKLWYLTAGDGDLDLHL
jgi:hypothetical protein